jgi:hypothetical protein
MWELRWLPGSLVTCATCAMATADTVERKVANRLFVQINNPVGNQILVYARGEDGALTFAETVDAGGVEGRMAGLVPIVFRSGLARLRRRSAGGSPVCEGPSAQAH